MDLSFVLVQSLTGLASASSLFITACGLTLVFGVTRIVNFAHGSLYMLGAYFAATLTPRLLDLAPGSTLAFFAGILAASLAVGVLGVLLEVLLLRRIYASPELFQLLTTFGVVLIIQDLTVLLFGPAEVLGPQAPGLRGPVTILEQRFPAYDLAMIVAAALVFVGLHLLLRATRFGVLIRAATQDREMVGALGVNQALLFTATLFVGSALAGLGGALQIPRVPANTGMDLAIIAECFVVTVVGGMGSITGAFLAAVIIGQLQAFGILVFPKITLVLVFLLMALVLVLRPYGLLGRAETAGPPPAAQIATLRPMGPKGRLAGAALVALLALLPLVADAYALKLGTEVFIFALLAASLHLLIGVGGLVSFGHAAWFGLGAYGAALALKSAALPMEVALAVAPLAAALGALVVGFFVVRLAGIYLAMLTLAAAQILYATAFQWVEVTGGDNGIVGVWPSAWASGRIAFYLLALALCAAAIVALRHLAFSPFGYALRAMRDSAPRAEAIGLDIRTHRLLAFTLAAAAAGLAGGLYAFSRGSIDPSVLAIPTSVDALTMVLVGGVNTLAGPLAGAAGLHLLRDAVMPLTELWRLVLGASIVALVLLFPEGLVGTLQRFAARWRPA